MVVDRAIYTIAEVSLDRTATPTEDSGRTDGWSIADESLYLDTSVWEKNTSNLYQIEVRGFSGTTLAPAVMVKNTGQTADGSAIAFSTNRFNPRTKLAQEFFTGTNAAGYRLNSISFDFGEIGISTTTGDIQLPDGDLEVTLNAPSSINTSIPGDVLCTLSNPASYSSSGGVHTFDVRSGSSCPTLEVSETYFVVMTRTRGNDTVSLEVTTSANEDSVGAAGAAIADRRARTDSGGSWVKTDSQSHLIEVRAQVVADAILRPDQNFFKLALQNDRPYGLWSDGTTMWVGQLPTVASTNPGFLAKIFAYGHGHQAP